MAVNTTRNFRSAKGFRYAVAIFATLLLFANDSFSVVHAVPPEVLFSEPNSQYVALPAEAGYGLIPANPADAAPGGHYAPAPANGGSSAGSAPGGSYLNVPGNGGNASGPYGTLPLSPPPGSGVPNGQYHAPAAPKSGIAAGYVAANAPMSPALLGVDDPPYASLTADPRYVKELSQYLYSSTAKKSESGVSIKESALKNNVRKKTKEFWLQMFQPAAMTRSVDHVKPMMTWTKRDMKNQAGEVLEDLKLGNSDITKFHRTFKDAAVDGFGDAMGDFLKRKEI